MQYRFLLIGIENRESAIKHGGFGIPRDDGQLFQSHVENESKSRSYDSHRRQDH
jgi:hypothetical protein